MGLMLAFNISGVLAIQGLQHLQAQASGHGFMQHTGITPPRLIATMLALNTAAIGLALLWRERRLQPWVRFSRLLPPAGTTGTLLYRLRLANDVARDHASRSRALQYELDVARQLLRRNAQQQEVLMGSLTREIRQQYQHVLSYAHYLDEHIARQHRDRQLRYDLDDLCESGFNLKLIAQSLELLRGHTPRLERVVLSDLLQQTMLTLAPALERRSMQLDTAGTNDQTAALADQQLLTNAAWMVLLGIIRYAADESTLQLRCWQDAATGRSLLGITISELAPGQLSPEERHAHLLRQLEHATPHMFAETIRLHANVQLAGWMLERSGGHAEVRPLSAYACEIVLCLPTAKK